MKYVRHKSKGFFLFPDNGDGHPWHKDMADFVGREEIISAGFVKFENQRPVCWGMSESLSLPSIESDTQELQLQMDKSMLDDRYLNPVYAARYLEAEWGDLLLRYARFEQDGGAPFAFQGSNVGFYTKVVEMIQRQIQLQPKFCLQRMADFGCATGRLVRELCHAFPRAIEVHGYEPSTVLGFWAHQMITGEEPLLSHFPCIGQPTGKLLEVEVTPALRAVLEPTKALHAARITLATAEMAEVPAGHFDLICCLNVLDRHSNPFQLVDTLAATLCDGGWLCLSSPLEWQVGTTPQVFWRDSVQDFLSPTQWKILDQSNLPYQFRVSNRHLVHYATQVILAQRYS